MNVTMPFWNFMNATDPTGDHDFPSTPRQNKGGKAMSNIETLKNRFLQGRLTRRKFLAQVSALGLAAPSLLPF
jgi:hypothetical protein